METVPTALLVVHVQNQVHDGYFQDGNKNIKTNFYEDLMRAQGQQISMKFHS